GRVGFVGDPAVAVAGQREDVGALRQDVGAGFVGVCAHVAARDDGAARVLKQSLVRVLAIHRRGGRVDDLLVGLVVLGGGVRVQHELAGARAANDVRALSLAVRAELAARLAGQNEALVLPGGEIAGRVHREADEVVVGGGAEEVHAVHVERVAHLDDAAAVRVHALAVGVHERNTAVQRAGDRADGAGAPGGAAAAAPSGAGRRPAGPAAARAAAPARAARAARSSAAT